MIPAKLIYVDSDGDKHIVDVLMKLDPKDGSIDRAKLISLDHIIIGSGSIDTLDKISVEI